MRGTVFLRKALFWMTGRPVLMDRVRNHVYRWAWERLSALAPGSSVLDIGSRNSSLPAFLAWRGFAVTSCERDERWREFHDGLGRRWSAGYRFVQDDVRTLPTDLRFDAVLSLFALQHAQESDRECHAAAAKLVARGGIFLSAVESTSGNTHWDRGRIDGDLRVYGPDDRQSRIVEPLEEKGLTVVDQRFLIDSGRRIVSVPPPQFSGSGIWLVMARKPL